MNTTSNIFLIMIANILSENPKLKLSEIQMQAEDYYGKEVADIMASAMRSDVVQMNTINMDKLIGKKAAIGNMNKAVTDMTKTIDQVRELRTAILGRMSDEEFERADAQRDVKKATKDVEESTEKLQKIVLATAELETIEDEIAAKNIAVKQTKAFSDERKELSKEIKKYYKN